MAQQKAKSKSEVTHCLQQAERLMTANMKNIKKHAPNVIKEPDR